MADTATVRVVAVVGAGTMGPGMVAVLNRSGFVVRLTDISDEALERAKGTVRDADRVLSELGYPETDSTVEFVSSLSAAVDGADLVIEAVPESAELKRRVLSEIEALVRPDTVIASNTSGIPITDLSGALESPSRLVGMHWSNPPHLIPMIEVVPGQATSGEVVASTAAVATAVGYEPVVEKEIMGFVENRILYAILRECLDLVERGIVDPTAMDECVRWGIGYKLAVIGPMALLDVAGLDIYQSVASYLNEDLSDRKDVSTVITEATDHDRLGMKTLGGLFDYTEESRRDLMRERFRRLVLVRKALSGEL